MAGHREDLETLFARRAQIDRALMEEHTRELAILFTDIVGSTQYFESHGDIAGLELVRRHNALLFPVVREHGGWVVKTIGDAILAVFDSPLAATRCAVAMQRALHAENAGAEEAIHIRIGGHFGRAIVDEGKDVYGDAVNTAARVVSQAGGDEIVVSAALAAALPDDSGVVAIPHGSFQPRGKSEAVRMVLVHWREDAPPPPAAHGAAERPPRKAHELFALELLLGARGLKVAALNGAADKGTVKAYADVELSVAGLDELAQRFMTFMRAGGTGSYVQRVRELGAELFAKAMSERARRQLAQTQLQFLRLHLEDQLVHVPWELLHDGREFLSLRFAMGRVVSARVISRPVPLAQQGPPTLHALVVSNASGDLEAAIREGEAVAGLLRDGWAGEVRHVRGPVRRAEFLAALPGCALLHFAGHAEQPGRHGPGGFRLSDGVVSPEEVAAAVGAAAPPLVFANGCHASSAEGLRAAGGSAGEDLASAFLLRGCRHFVGPRWDIADEDALTFALRFYEKALCGVELGEAVRQARQALVGPGARPLSFAGYVLYGDPRDALPPERIRLRTEAATRSSRSRDNLPQVPLAPEPHGPPVPRRSRRAVAAVSLAVLLAGAAAVSRLLQAPEEAVQDSALVAEPAQTAPTASAASGPSAGAPAGPVRLCVLPFKNISGHAELDVLREGLTETVVTDFGQAAGIRLIERAQLELDLKELEFSNSRYVDPLTRAKIGGIQGAEVVVLGGFQRAGERVRAHARFVHVETGEVLHAVKVESTVKAGNAEALLVLQDALAEEVRNAVQVVVSRARPR